MMLLEVNLLPWRRQWQRRQRLKDRGLRIVALLGYGTTLAAALIVVRLEWLAGHAESMQLQGRQQRLAAGIEQWRMFAEDASARHEKAQQQIRVFQYSRQLSELLAVLSRVDGHVSLQQIGWQSPSLVLQGHAATLGQLGSLQHELQRWSETSGWQMTMAPTRYQADLGVTFQIRMTGP